MRPLALQTLTWATIAGAVVSAFWLAAVDLGWSEWRNPFSGEAVFQVPSEPTKAGPPQGQGQPLKPGPEARQGQR